MQYCKYAMLLESNDSTVTVFSELVYCFHVSVTFKWPLDFCFLLGLLRLVYKTSHYEVTSGCSTVHLQITANLTVDQATVLILIRL